VQLQRPFGAQAKRGGVATWILRPRPQAVFLGRFAAEYLSQLRNSFFARP
jgi:hypothetical protein